MSSVGGTRKVGCACYLVAFRESLPCTWLHCNRDAQAGRRGLPSCGPSARFRESSHQSLRIARRSGLTGYRTFSALLASRRPADAPGRRSCSEFEWAMRVPVENATPSSGARATFARAVEERFSKPRLNARKENAMPERQGLSAQGGL